MIKVQLAKKGCSMELKASSKSSENKIPPLEFSSVKSSISLTSRIDSPVYLPLT